MRQPKHDPITQRAWPPFANRSWAPSKIMTPQKSRDEAPPLRTPRRSTPLLPQECLLVNIEGNIGIGKRRGGFREIVAGTIRHRCAW